ncbi:MAG: dTDP-4-dehydrorhamnose reductase [Xanthomonadales bacterium]
MKILLTGAAGQLGRELAPRLAQYGEVVGIDRAPSPAATSLQQDLGDAAAVERLLATARPALIVNAAAHTAVDRAEEERDQAFRLNAELPAWLARWARTNDAPLVHYSTDYVFSGDAARPYTEDDPAAPLNVYGESKLAGEQAVADSGCRHVTLRTSWVYSGHGHNFVLTMLRLARERDALEVVDDQVGRPTWARNLARVSSWAVERWRTGATGEALSGLYHYADGTAVSWYGFAEHIFRVGLSLGLIDRVPALSAVGTERFQQAATRPAYSVLDTSRIEQALNFRPAGVGESLEACLEGVRNDR